MRDAAVEGFHQAWERMTRHCPAHVYERDDQLIRADMGIPVAPFNGIWVTSPDPDPARVLAAVDQRATSSLPWNVQLRPGAGQELEEGLTQRGLVRTAEIPLMAAAPDSLTAPTADLDWSLVASYEDIGEHLRLLEEAFGMPAELTRQAFPMSVFFAPGLSTWLGRSGGDVVTTAVHLAVNGTVGVFNVATPESLRGKGYGGAATLQCARAGFAEGAELVWLQASPLGEPVYHGLGFQTVETWTQWMPQQYVH